MGCNVNVCGCPFQSSHHATCSEMQRNAEGCTSRCRSAIFALTWQFSERWLEAPLCLGSLRHSALHLPTLHRLNRLQRVEINAPFLHFKAASFSTPSLRCDDLGTRSAQTGFALKAIPLPGQTCSVQLHRRHSPWRSSPSFLHPFVTPPRSTPFYPSYPSSVVVFY